MSDSTTPQPQKMGDYEILGLLGAGGMGRVYKVRNAITDRVEAMKVLLPDLHGNEQLAARFLREIKLLAALRHPNIAALLTALTIDNQLVMIMEYVEGCTVASLLEHGAIAVPDALGFIDQVLDALSYAHRQNIVHRDIKPANMMLTGTRAIKLMDFGIARGGAEPNKLTATGSTLGSISYMSPEQIKGAEVDARSDLYSVGVSLYEMVTGQRPFQGDSDFSIMAAHINTQPTPPVALDPNLPVGLNEVILTAIAKAPEQRFQSADAFRNAIRAVRQAAKDSRTVVMGSDVAAVVSATPVPPMAAMNTVAAAAPAAAATIPAVSAPQKTVAAPAPAVAVAPVPLPAAAAASHRGLYVTLGALVVLVVIAAAAVGVPRLRKAVQAGESTAPAATAPATTAQPQAAQPASSVTPPPAASPAPEQQPDSAAAPQSQTGPANAGLKSGARATAASAGRLGYATGGPGASRSTDAAAAEKAAAAALSAELDKAQDEVDQLSTRAAAVNGSLDRLQQQQSAAGYGLRGDMAGKQSSMKLNLAKAQDAIQRRDAEGAKRYAKSAERDLEGLERFLGR